MAGNMPSNIPPAGKTNPQENLRTKIDAIYSGEFLLELGQEFQFDGADPEIAEELRLIGLHYLRLRKVRNSSSNLADARRTYADLAKKAGQFVETLENARKFDIQADMRLTAIRLDEPVPKTPLSGLSKYQRESGEPYFLELLRLARLLRDTAAEQVENATKKRGPKFNPALEGFVRRAADFWISTLGRKFIFDHHSPAKPGIAWIFVNSLLLPLLAATGDKISPMAIKTAIRNENGRRWKFRRP